MYLYIIKSIRIDPYRPIWLAFQKNATWQIGFSFLWWHHLQRRRSEKDNDVLKLLHSMLDAKKAFWWLLNLCLAVAFVLGLKVLVFRTPLVNPEMTVVIGAEGNAVVVEVLKKIRPTRNNSELFSKILDIFRAWFKSKTESL